MRLNLWTKTLLILLVVSALAASDLPTAKKEWLRAVPLVGNYLANQKINLGLDLQGGTHLDYKVITKDIPKPDVDAVVRGVQEVFERRVNGLGVSEPNIFESQVGDERHIIVELAGIKDEPQLDENGEPVLDEDGNPIIIKGVDKAKEIVGKTIQLEFKEQVTEIDPTQAIQIEKKARNFLTAAIADPENFTETFADFEDKPKITITEDKEWQWVSDLPESSQAVADLEVGSVYNGMLRPGQYDFTITASGRAVQKEGFEIVKLLEKEDAERVIEKEEERQASHILIAYAGADNASEDITRTEEEAQALAEEILAKAQAKDADFAELAKEYSDGPSGTKGGDLGSFKRGSMVPAFEDATFDTAEIGVVPQVVRTQFGYHVIKLVKIQEASSETSTETRVKLAKAYFSTVPDGWKSTGLTGQHFRTANLEFDQTTYRPIVSISFTQTAISVKQINYWQAIWWILAVFAAIAAFAYGIGIVMSEGRRAERGRDTLIAVVALAILAASIYGIWTTNTPADGDASTHELDVASEPTATDEASTEISETDKTGVDLFAELTKRNINKPMAIFLDGLPIIDTNGDGVINELDPAYAPIVQAEITNGQAIITGLTDRKEAANLVKNLKTGAIPAPVKLVGQYNVGATLGTNALSTSLSAGFYGLLIVMVFMIFYYRLPGFIASLALVIYGATLIFVLQVLGVVLTLAGVAGLILSVGMAVDANILIFERLKEELRLGKTLGSAVEDGFDRAWTSIRDSNVSTLITTAILYWFGSSIIQGFALTLAVGVLISMFTAITVSRSFLRLTIGTFLSRNSFFGVKNN